MVKNVSTWPRLFLFQSSVNQRHGNKIKQPHNNEIVMGLIRCTTKV